MRLRYNNVHTVASIIHESTDGESATSKEIVVQPVHCVIVTLGSPPGSSNLAAHAGRLFRVPLPLPTKFYFFSASTKEKKAISN
jgi:hypothetical protein